MRQAFMSGVLASVLVLLAGVILLPVVSWHRAAPTSSEGLAAASAPAPTPPDPLQAHAGDAATPSHAPGDDATPQAPDPDDAAIVLDVIARAEHDPSLLATLDAMRHPMAPAWRAFFVHAGYGPLPEDPRGRMRKLRARALAAVPSRLHFETDWTEEPPPELVSSLRFARDVSADSPGDDTPPCWIAARWTDVWLGAYLGRTGAIDDDDLPSCTLPAPLQAAQSVWDARLRAAYERGYGGSTHGVAPVCGGAGAARRHVAELRTIQALVDPTGFARDVPDVDAYARAQHERTLRAIYDVRSPRRLDPVALERMWRAMEAPDAWHRAVVNHTTRVLHLPADAARRHARLLAAYRRAAFLDAAAGCDWDTVPS